MFDTIGRYRIIGKLGEGGMGTVYSAKDESLGRSVAIKLIQRGADSASRERLYREARSAASVNHPNVCHIYELGEHEGELFVAMELLQGEPLALRINRAAMPPREAIEIATKILEALSALHSVNIIHRDLKPSNIFLTPHGVKLLDFGLALAVDSGASLRLTMPGMIAGTPNYMAPEQWASEPVGPPTDLFACGAILYEMLTGKAAFQGTSIAAVFHSISYSQPAPLAGGAEVQAIDRVIQRALSKRPSDRYSSAEEMKRALRGAIEEHVATAQITAVKAMKRLIVIPFRMLRPDPDIDFLAVSLPEAITASLCGLDSLVVRSSRAAARFPHDIEAKKLASEAEIDVALFGTLLRAGEQVRLTTQLVDAHSDTVIWSKAFQVPMTDILELHDQLTHGVVSSLSIPLSSREEKQLQQNEPSNARAYELYLRANHVGVSMVSGSVLQKARDLYRSAIAEDGRFAPAWARLGRVHRIMSKYGLGDSKENLRLAREAFDRAFELNPDLGLTHHYYTFFELEELGRAPQAVERLLDQARKHPTDPEIFGGLVAACRFVGLLDASVAAHQRAVRLDPGLRTSVHYTYLLQGDHERALSHDRDEIPLVSFQVRALDGGTPDLVRELDELSAKIVEGTEQSAIAAVRAAVVGDREACLRAADRFSDSEFHDPEGWHFLVRCLARVGVRERALGLFAEGVRRNFCSFQSFLDDPWLEPLHGKEFDEIIAEAKERQQGAAELYIRAGGNELLGTSVKTA